MELLVNQVSVISATDRSVSSNISTSATDLLLRDRALKQQNIIFSVSCLFELLTFPTLKFSATSAGTSAWFSRWIALADRSYALQVSFLAAADVEGPLVGGALLEGPAGFDAGTIGTFSIS